jgi:hypothetical protein
LTGPSPLPMAAPTKKPKEDIQRLIAKLGEWLKGGDGTSMDGGSSNSAAGEAQLVERFRTVLPRVLDSFLDPVRGASHSKPLATRRYSRAFGD